MKSKDEVARAWCGEAKPKNHDASKAAVARLSAAWQATHLERTRAIEASLLKERPGATADEKLLIGMAAHDAALSERLGRSEVELAERLLALIDDVKTAVALARTLREVTAVRGATAERVARLLQSAQIVRGQQKLAEIVPLRRVG